MMAANANQVADAQTVFDMVAKHMQQARANSEEEVRLKHLNEAKELILTKNTDLIDNFWNEMLALRHERSLGLTTFCLQWIRDSCQKDPLLLSEAVPVILQLMEHQSVIIQKHSLMAATFMYRNSFPFLISPLTKEADGAAVWAELGKLKEHIRYAVQEDFEQSHVGFRLVAYKFMEVVIICHTQRDEGRMVSDEDPVSSSDIPERCKILVKSTVEEEGNSFFQTLEDYLTIPELNVRYVDRMAICGCLFNLIKHRGSFLARVLTAIEFVHANVPEDFSKLQVEALRKYLKAGLLSVLRRSKCEEPDLLMRIANLLINLGTSNNEMARARPNLQEILKRRKREADNEPSSKRLKSGDESRSMDVSDFHALATDLNTSAITPKLTPRNVVELVISNMRKLPNVMPVQFNATYTPIGSGPMEGIIQHLSRILAVQMVAAAVGPGPEEVIRRRQEELSVKQQMEADAAEGEEEEEQVPQPISSILHKPLPKAKLAAKELQEEEDDAGDNSMDETEGRLVITESVEMGESFKPMEKSLHLTLITDQIPPDDRDNAMLTIVNELIGNDVNILNSAGEFMLHKCLIRFAVKVGKQVLRERVMKYILEDIGTRSELAFRWIYEEYAVAREMKRDSSDFVSNMNNYNDCLTKFIRGFIDHPEYREGLVSALYMEVPVITDEAIDLLAYYCAERSLHGAMRLIHKLVSSRPAPEGFLNQALNMTLNVRKDIQHQAVQTCIKIYETCPHLRQYIRDHAEKTMKYLCQPDRPPEEFFERHAKVGLSDGTWTEELQRLCTNLFIGLLADEPTLLPILGNIYNDINNTEAKKMIFKVIEQPMKAVQMNDPKVLAFVENPPKGSESLVLRIIHLLTETHPPSAELIASIRGLYRARIPDVRFLIPILNGLTKEEIFDALPKLITLNPVVVQEVFSRLLGTGKHKLDSSQRKPSVTPAEVLIELHKVEISKTDAKKLIKATGICLEEKDLYSAETMINILNDLVELDPLPFLLMRTVLQTLQMHPRSLPFVIKILHRLVAKEVWNFNLLWEGFVKCCEKTVPQSLPVLLQLPAGRLYMVLESIPSLKSPLQNYLFSLPVNQKALINPQVVCLVETGKLQEIRNCLTVDDQSEVHQNGDLIFKDADIDDSTPVEENGQHEHVIGNRVEVEEQVAVAPVPNDDGLNEPGVMGLEEEEQHSDDVNDVVLLSPKQFQIDDSPES